MDKHGFYPSVPCKVCGKTLEGMGSGHPAELYAGTYNGMCDSCTKAPSFRVEEAQYVSGAWRWSHPPYWGAYRRKREHFLAFEDCIACKGRGAKFVSRGDGQGGSYETQCPDCEKRHCQHPIVATKVLLDNVRVVKARLIQDVATRVWKKRCKKVTGVTPDPIGDLTSEQERLANEVRDAVNKIDVNTLGPISWPPGFRPTKAELRKVLKQNKHFFEEGFLASLLEIS